jgi:Uma2 family endonuclease
MTDTQSTYQQPESAHLPVTVEAYLEILDNTPAEVINGEIVPMSPPQLKHIRVAHRLYDSLNAHVTQKQLGEAFIEAPYLLDADDRTGWVGDARIPDVSFIAGKRFQAHLDKYGEAGPIRLAPDIAIEIVSPTDKFSEVLDKVALYLQYNVRLVIVFDPQSRRTYKFTPDNPGGMLLNYSDTLTGDPVLPSWSILLSDVFGAES